MSAPLIDFRQLPWFGNGCFPPKAIRDYICFLHANKIAGHRFNCVRWFLCAKLMILQTVLWGPLEIDGCATFGRSVIIVAQPCLHSLASLGGGRSSWTVSLTSMFVFTNILSFLCRSLSFLVFLFVLLWATDRISQWYIPPFRALLQFSTVLSVADKVDLAAGASCTTSAWHVCVLRALYMYKYLEHYTCTKLQSPSQYSTHTACCQCFPCIQVCRATSKILVIPKYHQYVPSKILVVVLYCTEKTFANLQKYQAGELFFRASGVGACVFCLLQFVQHGIGMGGCLYAKNKFLILFIQELGWGYILNLFLVTWTF